MDDKFDYQIDEFDNLGPFLYFSFDSNQQVEVFKERSVPHKVYWINTKEFQDVGWDEDDDEKLNKFIADSGGLEKIVSEEMEVLQRRRATKEADSSKPRRRLAAFTPYSGFSTSTLRSSEEWKTENARLLAENKRLQETVRKQADTIRKQADTIRTLENTNAQQKDDDVKGSERE